LRCARSRAGARRSSNRGRWIRSTTWQRRACAVSSAPSRAFKDRDLPAAAIRRRILHRPPVPLQPDIVDSRTFAAVGLVPWVLRRAGEAGIVVQDFMPAAVQPILLRGEE